MEIKDAMAVAKSKKSKGFFCISNEEIYCLLRHDVSWQGLAAKLVLSRFSDKSNNFSTAGHNAIANRSGVGIKTAKKVVAQIRRFKKPGGGLLFEVVGRTKLHSNPKLDQLVWRHDRNDKETIDSYIAIENALVGSRKSKDKKLSLFRKFKNQTLAARVYLLLLSCFSYPFHGCGPGALSFDSQVIKEISLNNYKIFKSLICAEPWFSDDFLSWAYDEGVEEINKNRKKRESEVAEILLSLEQKGLVERVVAVISTDKDENCYRLEYVLDTKTFGAKPFRLCDKIERTARTFDIFAAKGNRPFKFYKEYVAVVPQELNAEIMALFRPTHICWNPAILEAQNSLRDHKQKEQKVQDWLAQLT